MKTIVTWGAVALIVCADSISVRADQLAYNSRQVCQEAVKALTPGSFLVSYCSKCNDESVEIWQVSKALVVYTGYDSLYQVDIFCKKLYRSTELITEGRLSDSVQYEELSAAVSGCEDLYTLEEVDLAYIYVGSGSNSFQCLGKKLGLKCDVLVEGIALPQDVLARLNSLPRNVSR